MNPIGLTLITITTLFPAFQLFSLPDVSDKVALFSQYLGLAALILMAWGQILSTRISGIETLFGGLDRVYVLHKWAGIVAMVAILLHDTIDADMRGGRGTALTEIAETLGELSLYGLLILVVLSVATFVPYHLWKWTHKVMGAMFAAGVAHFVFIMKPFAMTDPAGVYTGVFCAAGIVAYLWMLLPEDKRPSRAFTVSKIEHSGGALAITMAPTAKPITPVAGQFGVVRFMSSGSGEPHPFSFSKIGADGSLRITVKALGDFTSRLGRTVNVGDAVRIQGPFGRFRNTGTRPQVWVGAGIGITPFVAWAAALAGEHAPIDLFYCVKSRDEAPHLDELETIAAATPNLRLHLIVSGQGQRISADMIAETITADLAGAKVSFCGPVTLREALRDGLRRHGVSPRRFHFEEFEFRTGIGMKKLAAKIVESRAARAAVERLKP